MDRIAQLQQLLSSNPADSFLHHALALEYVKLGDVAAARAAFLRNIEQQPDYLATYYHVGKLEEKEGHPEAAMQYYEQGMVIAKNQKEQHAYNELQAAYEALAY